MKLHTLSNDLDSRKKRKRVGRGPSSGMGKTSGRGTKGDGARSGYRRRYGYEGGQLPLYMKLPTRGFSRARFQKKLDIINLGQIEELFEDGETVNMETLHKHGFLSGPSHGIKVLSNGELNKKKITIEADAFSSGAEEKLKSAGISYKVVSTKESKKNK